MEALTGDSFREGFRVWWDAVLLGGRGVVGSVELSEYLTLFAQNTMPYQFARKVHQFTKKHYGNCSGKTYFLFDTPGIKSRGLRYAARSHFTLFKILRRYLTVV